MAFPKDIWKMIFLHFDNYSQLCGQFVCKFWHEHIPRPQVEDAVFRAIYAGTTRWARFLHHKLHYPLLLKMADPCGNRRAWEVARYVLNLRALEWLEDIQIYSKTTVIERAIKLSNLEVLNWCMRDMKTSSGTRVRYFFYAIYYSSPDVLGWMVHNDVFPRVALKRKFELADKETIELVPIENIEFLDSCSFGAEFWDQWLRFLCKQSEEWGVACENIFNICKTLRRGYGPMCKKVSKFHSCWPDFHLELQSQIRCCSKRIKVNGI